MKKQELVERIIDYRSKILLESLNFSPDDLRESKWMNIADPVVTVKETISEQNGESPTRDINLESIPNNEEVENSKWENFAFPQEPTTKSPRGIKVKR